MARLTPCSTTMTAMAAGVLALLLAGLLIGCGTTPMSTRAIEEKYLDDGHANRMYEYGEVLLSEGRYEQAYVAFLDAETTAYTTTLREAARRRRMWLGDSIAKMQQTGGGPLPPSTEMGESLALTAPTLPPAYQEGHPAPESQVLPPVAPGGGTVTIPGPNTGNTIKGTKQYGKTD